MEVIHRRKRNKIVAGSLVELYPHDLQLYTTHPLGNVPLSEFEEMALERLKVLRLMEQINVLGRTKGFDEWKSAVIAEMKKQGIKSYVKLIMAPGTGTTEAELQARKQDHISHFALRLTYCRSEEMRRWFLGREVDLFRLRFMSLNSEGVKNFLRMNNLDYFPIPIEEKDQLKEELLASTIGATHIHFESLNFYKVPFTDVPDLVRMRKVYLSRGCAYVPNTDLISVLLSLFRTNLSQALVYASRRLPLLEGDDRLYQFLEKLHYSYTGKDHSLKVDQNQVVPEQLDSLSQISFPLCMRQIHEHIRSTHHARHGSRMQYGLFIKGIGVTMEDSLRFWKDEFTKKIESDKFDRQYSYTVRHNYGKEGKHTNYSPYSCIKIIMSGVGPGDTHGCPFKHNDPSSLRQRLFSNNILSSGINEVLEFVSRGHYQLACGRYFELTHGVLLESPISHPNEYFNQSRKVLSGKGVKMERGEAGCSKRSTIPVKEDMWEDDFNESIVSETECVLSAKEEKQD